MASNHFLSLYRELINDTTGRGTISSPLFYTKITADEQSMANLVFAVMMGITLGLLAQVTGRNNFVTDSLAEPFVKDEVLAFKFVL